MATLAALGTSMPGGTAAVGASGRASGADALAASDKRASGFAELFATASGEAPATESAADKPVRPHRNDEPNTAKDAPPPWLAAMLASTDTSAASDARTGLTSEAGISDAGRTNASTPVAGDPVAVATASAIPAEQAASGPATFSVGSSEATAAGDTADAPLPATTAGLPTSTVAMDGTSIPPTDAPPAKPDVQGATTATQDAATPTGSRAPAPTDGFSPSTTTDPAIMTPAAATASPGQNPSASPVPAPRPGADVTGRQTGPEAMAAATAGRDAQTPSASDGMPSMPEATAEAAPAVLATVSATTGRNAAPDGSRDIRRDAGDGAISPAPPAAVAPEARFTTIAELRHAASSAAIKDAAGPPLAADSPRFGDDLGARVTWLVDQHIGRAEIQLSPGDLGQIDVRLSLDGQQVRAEFASGHADVRSAIEQHLPRLREMLGNHGFTLADAQVGQQQRSPQQVPTTPERPGSDGTDDLRGAAVPHAPTVTGGRRLLDEYA